jgi:hypothetical protein
MAGRAPKRDRRVVAGLERRHGIERGGEGERPAFLDRHVEDVRHIDRFHSPLA